MFKMLHIIYHVTMKIFAEVFCFVLFCFAFSRIISLNYQKLLDPKLFFKRGILIHIVVSNHQHVIMNYLEPFFLFKVIGFVPYFGVSELIFIRVQWLLNSGSHMTVCESLGVLLKNINYWSPPKPHESNSPGAGPGVCIFKKLSK